ncbi:glycosyltransferase family 8 protein [Niallia sp. MER 6]|uniref:glycosyltransferase family 8 protein n=1 Tax=Niallia sp. MER 6 TaxID=2939567 RepID=UPI00203B1D41|nr:glycosyltransferase family 8 protein [Niallia sp. MER 6]MCM3029812.1 glycosyltransferase family 8 protein [Niallia sp. MER 6]
MNNKDISVFSVANNKYIQPLAVMLYSLVENSSVERINIYIIDSNLTEENKKKLNKTFEKLLHVKINYLIVDDNDFLEFPISRHITKEAYYRLVIPELLKNHEIDKIIYLDCDLLVLKDLNELISIDLENNALGAVRDLGGYDRYIELGMLNPKQYFNSGVMVLNLKYWRENLITEKVIEYIRNNKEKLTYHDQDALNAVLHNSSKLVDIKWNVQSSMFTRNIPDDLSTNIKEALSSPGIIHFTGYYKPWLLESNHPYKKFYYEYLSKTAWKGYKPKITLLGFLKKIKAFIKNNK